MTLALLSDCNFLFQQNDMRYCHDAKVRSVSIFFFNFFFCFLLQLNISYCHDAKVRSASIFFSNFYFAFSSI